MKKLDDYAPNLSQKKRTFTLPSLVKNWKAYIFIIAVSCLVIFSVFYRTTNIDEKGNEVFAIINAQIDKNEKFRDDALEAMKKEALYLGYEDDDIKNLMAKSHYQVANPRFTIEQARIDIDKMIADYQEAQALISKSIFKDTPKADVPNFTDEGQAYLKALDVPKPDESKIYFWQYAIINAKKAVTLSSEQKKTAQDIYDNLHGRAEAQREKQAKIETKKAELALQQQVQKQNSATTAEVSNVVLDPKPKPQEQPKPVAKPKPKPTPVQKPKPVSKPKSNVPEW